MNPDLDNSESTLSGVDPQGRFLNSISSAKEMVGKGCTAIELCGGFGIRGTYMVEEAVHGRARVGSVRFDIHPGLDNKSGDEVFE